MNVKKLMDNQKCLPVVCDCDNNVGFVLICVGFSVINMLKYGNAFIKKMSFRQKRLKKYAKTVALVRIM